MSSAIQTTLDDCKSASSLFTLPHVVDGDRGINANIEITTKTFDSEGNPVTDAFEISGDGKTINKCDAAEDSSTYIVEFKAVEENNDNRFSYYYTTITIGTTEVEKDDLIKLADGLESITQWKVDFADGNYVTSVCNEDDSNCQSQKLKFEAGDGATAEDTIIMASRTPNFIIDEWTGHVMYTGSPSGKCFDF